LRRSGALATPIAQVSSTTAQPNAASAPLRSSCDAFAPGGSRSFQSAIPNAANAA
jgi:hypothetical protein